jgi:hypothetical protein
MSSQVDKKLIRKAKKDLDGCMTPKTILMWLTKQREFGCLTKNIWTCMGWTNIKRKMTKQKYGHEQGPYAWSNLRWWWCLEKQHCSTSSTSQPPQNNRAAKEQDGGGLRLRRNRWQMATTLAKSTRIAVMGCGLKSMAIGRKTWQELQLEDGDC